MDDIRISLDTAGQSGDVTLVRVDGVIDTMTSSELERVMNSLMEQKRYKIIIDLAGVDYISSAGWGIFISNIREIKSNSGDIKLARMIPSVYEIFELLEFDSILKAYDNIEKAKIEFRGGNGHSGEDAAAEVRQHNQKEAEKASIARQVEVATAEADPPPARIKATAQTQPEIKAAPPVTARPSAESLVLSLVKTDPFYSISEIVRIIRSDANGDGQKIGWWGVWSILRRHSLLSKKNRFRYSRKA